MIARVIHTKYLGPSDTKGARIFAKGEPARGKCSYTLQYPHEMSATEAHRTAAQMYCFHMKWSGTLMVESQHPTKSEYTWVMVE